MKNGLDRQDDQGSNVIPLAGARKRAAKGAARAGEDRGRTGPRLTAGQFLTSALFVALAIGGVLTLAAPLLRAAGILGG